MTVQEVLETYLTSEERERWYNNRYGMTNFTFNSNHRVISGAFSWGSSPEGVDYWSDIYMRVNDDIRIKPIKPIKSMNKHEFI